MNILVVCAVGMSSSVLVNKLRQEVKSSGYEEIKIGSSSLNDFEQYLDRTDILVLAPQLIYLKESINFKNKIYVIDPNDYGNLDSKAILYKLLNEDNTNVRYSLLYKISGIINNFNFIKCINRSFITLLPVTLIGSVLTIVHNLNVFNNYISEILALGIDMSIGCISLYMAFIFGYELGNENKVNGNSTGLISLISFLILISEDVGFIDLYYLGVNGLFTSIIISFFSSFITIFLLKIHKVRDLNYPKKILDSFLVVVPGMINICVLSLIIYFVKLTDFGSFPKMIEAIVQNSLNGFLGNSIGSYLFFGVLINLFWFVGIHGGNIVKSITNPLYIPMALENIKYFELGNNIPNLITNMTVYIYNFGGAGSTLGLIFLIILFGKSKKLRSLASLSAVMGLFNINEPILFGLPIIFNMLVFIPFVFIGPFCGLITFIAMKMGIIPYVIGYQIPWNTPIIISGFIQGGWILALWQFLMLALSMFLWFPFFKIIDNKEYSEENKKMPN